MATPQWITPVGFLGTVTELTSSTFTLSIANPTTSTAFTMLSGSLPTGLQLSNTGTITGIPSVVSDITRSTFVIRANNTSGITDRTFYIDAQGSTAPIWVTPSDFLYVGIYGQAYCINMLHVDYQLNATYDVLPVDKTLKYFIAESDGSLPPGLVLSKSGRITGIVDDTLIAPTDIKTYEFYVTVSDSIESARRLFKIRVAGPVAFRADDAILKASTTIYNSEVSYFIMPEWATPINLGVVRTNNYQVIAIDTYDGHPTIGTTLYDWTNASINPEISAFANSTSTETKIVGTPVNNPIGHIGYQLTNREGDSAIHIKSLSAPLALGQVFRLDPYTVNSNSTEYEITNLDSTGLIINFGIRTSDTTIIPAVLPVRILDETPMYFGSKSQHPLNFRLDPDSGSLYGAFPYQSTYTTSYRFTVRILKIDTAIDFIYYCGLWKSSTGYRINDVVRIQTLLNYDPSTGRVASASQLPTTNNYVGRLIITVDTNHVWKYVINGPINGYVDLGHIAVTGLGTGHYTYFKSKLVHSSPVFDIDNWQIYDINNSVVSHEDKTFILTTRGDEENSIKFITSSDLGIIYPGYQSELAIQAKHTTRPLEIMYKVINGELPPGIQLQYDGTLTGKVPYDFKTIFDFTLDNAVTTFDTLYEFTVQTSDMYGIGIAEQLFKITVQQPDLTKYTNIYAAPLLSATQRNSYAELITNETIFDSASMYRPHDSAFGVQHTPKLYIEHGIEQLNAASYVGAFTDYCYKKRFLFGDIKTKIAKDINGTYIYDVVYVEIIDPLINNQGQSVAPYIDSNNGIIYQNSVINMRAQLEAIAINDVTIKVDEQMRPKFMRTVQSGIGSPLGFILAIPLCYALPTAGNEIVKRLNLYNFDFKTINFEIDRLVVEDTLLRNGTKYVMFPRGDSVLLTENLIPFITEDNNKIYME